MLSTHMSARPVNVLPHSKSSRTTSALTASRSVMKRQVAVAVKSSGDDTVAPALKISLGIATSAAMLFSVLAGPVTAQEIATIAADSPVDDAAELGRTLLPNPSGLLNSGNAAKDAEAQEKRAVDAPQSSFRAASPVGGEGEISNLADQGLKGGAGFKAAADQLNTASSAEQYAASQELDKKLQKEDDYKRAAEFRADAPGSKLGNSVIGRGSENRISGGGDKPEAPSASGLFGFGK